MDFPTVAVFPGSFSAAIPAGSRVRPISSAILTGDVVVSATGIDNYGSIWGALRDLKRRVVGYVVSDRKAEIPKTDWVRAN